MYRIMLLNAKGGCGKTTIATSLASHFAARGRRTALMDFDPHGPALAWLKLRNKALPHIQAVDGGQPQTGVTRTWQLHTQTHTEIAVMDAPAGIKGNQLADLMARADLLLVPLLPSVLDVQVTKQFLDNLLAVGKLRRLNKPIGLVLNRAEDGTKFTHEFQHFLTKHKIPLVTQLRDTPNYNRALAAGKGILELESNQIAKDQTQWWPLTEWLREQMGEEAQELEDMLVG